jgi:hypothetical protein
MNNLQVELKRTLMAVGAMVVLGMAGTATDAQALEATAGDLIFALYGNNTEYVENLGSRSTLLAPNTTTVITLNSSLVAGGTGSNPLSLSGVNPVSGGNPVAFTVFGYSLSPSAFLGGSSVQSSDFTSGDLANTHLTSPFNTITNWFGQLTGDGLKINTFTNTNGNSFTSQFGTSNTLAGGYPVQMAGGLGSLLYLINGNKSGTLVLTQLGTALLSADGSTLTISTVASPVPLPAAVVLFGTGLIGLVGVARRSLSRRLS